MTSAKSSETLVSPTESGLCQSSFNLDNQTSRSNFTPEFQRFVVFLLYFILDL